MKLKYLLLPCLIATNLQCFANIRIDVKNELDQTCSLAIHARADKTEWITQGWYVFMPGEEAPIILDKVKDSRDVFIYHDCNMQFSKDADVKTAWVKENYKFQDNIPKIDNKDYKEVSFIRLNPKDKEFTIKAKY